MFKYYNYVYAVYKEKSFTRAAQSLYISQPSLSAAIKKTESKIGAPLFERGSRCIIPTQIGKEYIDTCRKIINAEKEFETKLHDIYSLETGHITVGGTNYLSCYALPQIINRFKTMYPKIDVNLEEAKSATLEEMIRSEQLDIVIDSFDDIPDVYMGYPLCFERILICVPKEWEINNKLTDYQITPESIYSGEVNLNDVPPVDISLFKDCSFILLKNGNDMQKRSSQIFSDSGIAPKVSFEVNQLNISCALAESGMGACFATDTLFRYDKFNKNVILYNVDKKYCNRTLYVVHNKNKYCSSTMEKFIEVARDILQKSK